jgi:type II secretory pathway component PulJ
VVVGVITCGGDSVLVGDAATNNARRATVSRIEAMRRIINTMMKRLEHSSIGDDTKVG